MAKFEEHFPEDIIRIIVDELIASNSSLQNVALISPLFLVVCRSYLFRSLIINTNHINAMEDLQTLSTAISDSKRGTQLAISITRLQISDHEGAIPQLAHAEHDLPDIDLAKAQNARASIKSPLGDTRQYLDKILPRLTNIRDFALSFESWVVPYHRLSPAVQEMLTRSTLQRVHLRGIEMLPANLSAKLLSIEEVSLSMCAFCEGMINPVERPKDIAIRSLRFEPFGNARGRDTANTARASPLHRWKAMGIDLLKLNELTIILSSWVGIIEAVPILEAFKDSVKSLSIHTEWLGLATDRPHQALVAAWAILNSFSLLRIRHRNANVNCCYPSDYLFSWEAADDIHNLYEILDKARPNAPVEERFEDGWLTRAMSSLSILVTESFKNLRTLDFSVSYWPNMMASETNEELAWICNILADTPPSTALALEGIRVKIHIRTLHCAENQDVALTLDEYEGWNIWNEELCDEKWSGLKKVTFTISARMVCCAEIVEAWTQVISDIRNGPLADINGKGILDVGFVISKQ